MKSTINFSRRSGFPALAPFAVAASLLLGACGGEEAFDADAGDLSALGAAYVARRGCATCHEASGAGTLSGQTAPRPGTESYGANLTGDVATGLGGWADVAIVRALRAGVDPDGQPLCPPMPRFADLTDLEARAIVAYLRSLPPRARHIPESRCPPLKPPPPLDLAPAGDAATDAAAAPFDASAQNDFAPPFDGGASLDANAQKDASPSDGAAPGDAAPGAG